MVDVSIIVPTYNSASHLDRCLGSIGAQKDIRAELHVIDDNSKDDTQQKVLAFTHRTSTCICMYAWKNAASRRLAMSG